MKNLLIIIFLLFLVSCKEETQTEKEQKKAIQSEYEIKCVDIGGMYRCENKEVVCYNNYGVESIASQCKFKGE